MKNNTVGKISVATAERQRTLKNKSSDLHTTMDFGSVMCAKLQRCIPGTDIRVGTKERVLLTSLVCPTFGRMSLKAYHRFVPFSDLTRNYSAMMADQQVYRGSSAFIPQKVPNIPINELSLFVLFGAQMSIYEYGAQYLDLRQIPANLVWNSALNALPQACQTAFQDLGIATANGYGLTNAYYMRARTLIPSDQLNSQNLFISNPNPCSFFDWSTNHPTDLDGFGKSYVSIEGADYLVRVSIDATSSTPAKYYLLAFRLSSFGRRLRKNLIGCGWEFNLDDSTPVSILPLIAYYKAYFDTFGLTLYQNWEETYAYSLLQMFDLMPDPSIHGWYLAANQAASPVFRNFILNELAQTFFTDEQDFVSAHTRTTAVAPYPGGLIYGITADVDSTGGRVERPNIETISVSSAERADLNTPNGHAYINDVIHGHLDSKLLMRLYQQTNAQTIAGRRIAELLRVQGFGKYVDEHKSNFIGSWSLDLNVYDLPSQSDTYQNAHDGMRLGEMGAFGKSSGQHPMVSYTTEEDGYFITLMVCVPKGGYAETVDPDMLCINKWQQYQPKYDSLGYEFNRKMCTVQGSQPWTNMSAPGADGSLGDSFGLAPRDFKRKFGRNVLNGDMSLRSTRHTYAAFNLERLIQVGEHQVGKVDTSTSGLTRYPWESVNFLNPSRVPIAGNVWRYPTRYEWISDFDRIFYNDSSSVDAYQSYGVGFDDAVAYGFFALRDDNFIVHVIFEMQVWDQMLPVQDSFETDDEEKRADTSIAKA